MAKTAAIVVSAALFSSSLYAYSPKFHLSGDRRVSFENERPVAGTLWELFAKGSFYGRLRVNTFLYNWKEEVEGSRKDNWAAAVGGSLLYRSASYEGFSFSSALYTSQNPWHMADSDAIFLKAGKDATSRYNVLSSGEWSMSSLAQAFIQYERDGVRFRAGRQLFESLLTASNDTKMIPNAFEGYTFRAKFTLAELKVAYLQKQKLRDHTNFHHLLAYGDDPLDPYSKYRENDDSAMHRGLTVSRLASKGIEDRLAVLQYEGAFFQNGKLLFNITAVPKLLRYATAETHYRFDIKNLYITPGVRYLRQFDDGAGAIGGANLRENIIGYKDPNSLDSALYAFRVDVGNGVYRVRLGYSYIADKGDIVAPWRGFPTGGFTRAMGQYNWYANTKSYMLRFDYDFKKSGVADGLKCMLRYVVEDFDDTKPGVQADADVVNFDVIKRFERLKGLELRFRAALSYGEAQSAPLVKADPTYSDVRVEMNYLF